MSQEHLRTSKEEKDMRVKPRNYPVIAVFWVFVIFLLYLFYKAFAH
jgi:hypothetical protein